MNQSVVTRMRCDVRLRDLASVHRDWSNSEPTANSAFGMLSRKRRFVYLKLVWRDLEFGVFVWCFHLWEFGVFVSLFSVEVTVIWLLRRDGGRRSSSRILWSWKEEKFGNDSGRVRMTRFKLGLHLFSYRPSIQAVFR